MRKGKGEQGKGEQGGGWRPSLRLGEGLWGTSPRVYTPQGSVPEGAWSGGTYLQFHQLAVKIEGIENRADANLEEKSGDETGPWRAGGGGETTYQCSPIKLQQGYHHFVKDLSEAV